MKKTLLFLFTLSFLLLPLASCSNEPVPYSDKLWEKSACYLDVLEILPQKTDDTDTTLYCQCVLENGEKVWMSIYRWEYIEYFTPEFQEDDDGFFPQCIRYEDVLRLQGTAVKIKDEIEKDTTVSAFRFGKADKESAAKPQEKRLAGSEFRSSLDLGSLVAMDVVRIAPKEVLSKFLSTESLSITTYYLLCECTTSQNEIATLLVDQFNYKNFFDASADQLNNPLSPLPSPIDLVRPVTIYAHVADPQKETQGSVQASGLDLLICFDHVEKEALSEAKIENQPAVAYSPSCREKQAVYLEIQSIKAEYEIHSYGINASIPYYVCRCRAADGSEIWICVSKYTYAPTFLNDSSVLADVSKEASFDSLKIYGRVEASDKMSDELAEKIGRDTVIVFSHR